MQATQPNRILPGISRFAWNKDCSRVALSPNSLEIWIFNTNNSTDISKWERIQVLKEVQPNILNDQYSLRYDHTQIILTFRI